MKIEAENVHCPDCGKEMLTYARGHDLRVYRCPHCGGAHELKLFLRPTNKLMALMPLKVGALIDCSVKQKSLLD